jgi:hypothetical protein
LDNSGSDNGVVGWTKVGILRGLEEGAEDAMVFPSRHRLEEKV